MVHRLPVESLDGTAFALEASEDESPIEGMSGLASGLSSAFGKPGILLGPARRRGRNKILGMFRLCHQTIKDAGHLTLCQNISSRRRFF
jgi:hypothetical protein